MQLNKSLRNFHFQLHVAKFAEKDSHLPISGNCAHPYVHLWRKKKGAGKKQVTIDFHLAKKLHSIQLDQFRRTATFDISS